MVWTVETVGNGVRSRRKKQPCNAYAVVYEAHPTLSYNPAYLATGTVVLSHHSGSYGAYVSLVASEAVLERPLQRNLMQQLAGAETGTGQVGSCTKLVNMNT